MSVELHEISHRFGLRWILKKQNVVAKNGETVAFFGPNGSGKSTLLKIIATLLTPTKGSGFILGHDLSEKIKIRRDLFWLGHDFGLYPFLSARENLLFFCEIRGETPDPLAIDAALEKVGLSSQAHRSVSTFSAGMKKRLSLAKPLLHPFKLILLDEPHTNLDRQGKELMDACIRTWRQQGTTLFLASHDDANITPLSDQVITL